VFDSQNEFAHRDSNLCPDELMFSNHSGVATMSRFMLCSLAAAAALLSVNVRAGNANAPGTDEPQVKAMLAPNTVHKLLKTYFETGATTTALGAGTFTEFGTPLAVNCANAAGCTIAVNMSAQLQAVATANNMALCMKLDGSTQACPFNTIIPAGSGFEVGNFQYFVEVPLGNHTVGAVVYTSVGTSLYRWVKETKLYKP